MSFRGDSCSCRSAPPLATKVFIHHPGPRYIPLLSGTSNDTSNMSKRSLDANVCRYSPPAIRAMTIESIALPVLPSSMASAIRIEPGRKTLRRKRRSNKRLRFLEPNTSVGVGQCTGSGTSDSSSVEKVLPNFQVHLLSGRFSASSCEKCGTSRMTASVPVGWVALRRACLRSR